MPDPVTTTTAVKAAVTVLTNEKTRKRLGCLVTALLSPLIMIVVLICCLTGGGAEHNLNAIELSFNGGAIPANTPHEFKNYIEDVQRSFITIENECSALQHEMEADTTFDLVRIKSVFFSLFFGEDRPSNRDHKKFVECFYKKEERTRFITATDDEGNEVQYTEAFMAVIPLESLTTIYANIAEKMGRHPTPEDKANASEIYFRVLYGASAPTYGSEFDNWLNGLPLSDLPFVGTDGFICPTDSDWRSVVTSEFGLRIDPFTGQTAGHTGIDLGMPKGTPIRAALNGTVYLVRFSTTGYGYHVMIDHGGGFVTLYAHCSKLLVGEGQAVTAGDVIAEVGSTGRSTGNHLHFEIRINGEQINPRYYLP